MNIFILNASILLNLYFEREHFCENHTRYGSFYNCLAFVMYISFSQRHAKIYQ